MEIVYCTKLPKIFKKNNITGFYGDILDLVKMRVSIEGINYYDKWTVKRFLNGLNIKLSPRIQSIFNYLGLSNKLLNVKLCNLSNTDFKFILLSKLLLMNKNYIIFDYFDIGLSNKDLKRLINIIRGLKRDGKTVIIISKNLVFMNCVVDSVMVSSCDEIIYNDSVIKLIETDMVRDPKIVKFINMANKKGAHLDYTLDSSELLKDIYRSVC